MLQCGDPSGTGATAAPTYRYAEENLPTGKRPAYAEGVVAMANDGQNPASTGSQFFIVYKDIESLLGRLHGPRPSPRAWTWSRRSPRPAGAGPPPPATTPQPAGDGHPKTEVSIKSLTMSAAQLNADRFIASRFTGRAALRLEPRPSPARRPQSSDGRTRPAIAASKAGRTGADARLVLPRVPRRTARRPTPRGPARRAACCAGPAPVGAQAPEVTRYAS